jgi:hypothetical protein
MAKNSYKINKGYSDGKNIFSVLGDGLRLRSLFDDGLPARYIPHVLFLTLLGIVYIGNNHWAERMIRRADTLAEEVEELRADYTSLKAEYMFASKQSEVAKKVKSIGLKESLDPPYKLEIDLSEY